jgi:hypothetical protein
MAWCFLVRILATVLELRTRQKDARTACLVAMLKTDVYLKEPNSGIWILQ